MVGKHRTNQIVKFSAMICENGRSPYRKFKKMRVKVALKGLFNGIRGKLFTTELIILDRRSERIFNEKFLTKNRTLV